MSSVPQSYIPRKALEANKFQADPMNSTYRWEFYLTPGRAGNRVALLDGYSKGLGFENTNKVELLYKKLINPILPYLVKCDYIIIYEQDKGLPKQYHTKLLELYPRDFQAHSWVGESPVFTDYLDLYYRDYIKSGKMPPVEDRRKNVRQPLYLKDLDHTTRVFGDLDELKRFCAERKEKYSPQCMYAWYYKHAEFQPELFENDITGTLQHVAHTSPTAEGAQAAINQLASKYNARS